MTHSDPFDELRLRHEALEERHRCLTGLWPDAHALGVIPLHQVRLRYRFEEEA